MTDKFHWHKEYGKSNVPSAARSVAYIIWDHTDARGENAFPGVARLMAGTDQSRRTVLRHLGENEEKGWLGKVSSGSKSGKAGIASVYRLTYPSGYQVSPVAHAQPDQVSPMAPALPDQVSPVPKPGVTSGTPTDPGSNPKTATEQENVAAATGTDTDTDTEKLTPISPAHAEALRLEAEAKEQHAKRLASLPKWVTDEHRRVAESKSVDLVGLVEQTIARATHSKPNYLTVLLNAASAQVGGQFWQE